jgi:mono/diheme cytochrome c family protein
MKKTQVLLAGGVLLVALLLVGCPKAPTPTAPPAPPVATPPQPDAAALSGVALGERIYKTGLGAAGSHVPFTRGGDKFRASPGGCAPCHGEDGRGKTIPGKPGIPAVTYAALREPAGGKPPMFPSDEAVRKAITEGFEEGGEGLSSVMPRWQLTDEEFQGLLAYLKQLGEGQPPIEAPHEHDESHEGHNH